MPKVKSFKSFTFAWWQVSLLKPSLVSLGVIGGSTCPGVFIGWRNVLVVLFVVPGVYVTSLWYKQN